MYREGASEVRRTRSEAVNCSDQRTWESRLGCERCEWVHYVFTRGMAPLWSGSVVLALLVSHDLEWLCSSQAALDPGSRPRNFCPAQPVTGSRPVLWDLLSSSSPGSKAQPTYRESDPCQFRPLAGVYLNPYRGTSLLWLGLRMYPRAATLPPGLCLLLGPLWSLLPSTALDFSELLEHWAWKGKRVFSKAIIITHLVFHCFYFHSYSKACQANYLLSLELIRNVLRLRVILTIYVAVWQPGSTPGISIMDVWKEGSVGFIVPTVRGEAGV